MTSIYTITGGSLSALLSKFAGNTASQLLSAHTDLSADTQSAISSGVSALTRSAASGQASARQMLNTLTRAELPAQGRAANKRNAQPTVSQGSENQAAQTQTQMFAELLRMLRRGQRNL